MVENRRKLLILGGAALAGYAVLQRLPVRRRALAFTDHPGVPGFRILSASGQVSAASGGATQIVLLGLTPPTPLPEDAVAEVTADPHRALFGDTPTPGLAYFTDIRCPICRPYEANLARLRDENPGLVQVTHEFPVFGDGSILAARALIAAGPELAARMRPRLQRSPVVMSEAYLARVITDLDADPDAHPGCAAGGDYRPGAGPQSGACAALRAPRNAGDRAGPYGPDWRAFSGSSACCARGRARLSLRSAAVHGAGCAPGSPRQWAPYPWCGHG